MKKVFSFILATVFMISLSIIPVHAAETGYEKVFNDVNKTNAEIDKMIYEAVGDAEEEINKYIKDVEIIEKGKDLSEIDNKISELRDKRSNLDINDKDYLEKYAKIFKELREKEDQRLVLIQKKEARVNELESELKEMKEELSGLEEGNKKCIKIEQVINKLEKKIDRSNAQIAERTNKFSTRINEIIGRLVNDTNKKAAEMKKKAADKGVTVICEMAQVEIGGVTILVDPLRIAGY